jgi:hypothetical protein
MTTAKKGRKPVAKGPAEKAVEAVAAAIAVPTSPLAAVTRRKVAELNKELLAAGDLIAKQRDRLRDLLEEYESIANDCDGALVDIEAAVTKLSKLIGPTK